ncbi:MAG: TIGR00303 family protein [Oscillatoriaceae bacterium SKW80]|nr:TIGR00303 family protein [Oscillatoriaceae bacterium SKYG93]MCX8119544.1 TIGR00303 family protein [Oscillatoriaceae bacterium SKW80]MDW8455011.1 TIGR00303 family protein [Oscillatoriaceae cyanobacterium SKYGB_i_bin93]HIK28213.1 TIGR00303 family protein [Oscillatoriaceae cyanobacterium M7585_C2015_266]
MIGVYTQEQQGQKWLQTYRGCSPVFACVLGFTETSQIPGISAAGSTPEHRRYTAIADAEFLYNGPQPHPSYPLPPLSAGASPVLISRAVIAALNIPLYIFNAGLPKPPAVPSIDLGGTPARCLSTGCALDLTTVKHLFAKGIEWGEKFAHSEADYLIIGECVVGGTTTALAILTGLGVAAVGKVNSSHPICNHAQKWEIVKTGLQCAGIGKFGHGFFSQSCHPGKELLSFIEPFTLVAAVGDPMQVAVAGMALAASRTKGVLLAGGTQMLAVYALMQALARHYFLFWHPENVVVGTTRWVAEDPTADTVALARLVGPVPLLATQLSFTTSRYPQLQAYEHGYVKEGVGAGGCAIASHLYCGWSQEQLLQAVEELCHISLSS